MDVNSSLSLISCFVGGLLIGFTGRNLKKLSAIFRSKSSKELSLAIKDFSKDLLSVYGDDLFNLILGVVINVDRKQRGVKKASRLSSEGKRQAVYSEIRNKTLGDNTSVSSIPQQVIDSMIQLALKKM
jgi:hypothetical protein